MSSVMVTALSVEGPDGQFVDLITDGRTVKTIDGLIGPITREVTGPKPSRHGIINRSRYRDSKPVTIEGELFGGDAGDCWDAYNAVAAALAGAVDTDRQLRWTGGPVLDLVQTQVRLVSMSPPITVDRDVIHYQLILRPADPRSFSQTARNIVGDILSASGGGKIYPYTYPRVYTPAGGGSAAFTVAGTDSTPPVFRIHGNCTQPRVRLTDTGEEIRLIGEIGAGRYIDIDVAERTITLDDGTSKISMLDFENSTWFELAPGPHTVQMFATSFDSSAHVQVTYRDAYA